MSDATASPHTRSSRTARRRRRSSSRRSADERTPSRLDFALLHPASASRTTTGPWSTRCPCSRSAARGPVTGIECGPTRSSRSRTPSPRRLRRHDPLDPASQFAGLRRPRHRATRRAGHGPRRPRPHAVPTRPAADRCLPARLAARPRRRPSAPMRAGQIDRANVDRERRRGHKILLTAPRAPLRPWLRTSTSACPSSSCCRGSCSTARSCARVSPGGAGRRRGLRMAATHANPARLSGRPARRRPERVDDPRLHSAVLREGHPGLLRAAADLQPEQRPGRHQPGVDALRRGRRSTCSSRCRRCSRAGSGAVAAPAGNSCCSAVCSRRRSRSSWSPWAMPTPNAFGLSAAPWLEPLPAYLDQFALGMALAVIAASGRRPRISPAVCWTVSGDRVPSRWPRGWGSTDRHSSASRPATYLARHELNAAVRGGARRPGRPRRRPGRPRSARPAGAAARAPAAAPAPAAAAPAA